jgi:hypothetical protein
MITYGTLIKFRLYLYKKTSWGQKLLFLNRAT